MQTLKEFIDEGNTWGNFGGNWGIWKDEDHQNRYYICWLRTGVIFSYDYDENKSFKWLQNLMNADTHKKVQSILEHRRKTNVEWFSVCA